MRIFIFKSEANSELGAFSGESDAQQLPSKFGPWHAVGVVRPDKEPPYKLSRETIEQAISSQGFQLFRLKPKKAAVG
jgi:hypothetical protein